MSSFSAYQYDNSQNDDLAREESGNQSLSQNSVAATPLAAGDGVYALSHRSAASAADVSWSSLLCHWKLSFRAN